MANDNGEAVCGCCGRRFLPSDLTVRICGKKVHAACPRKIDEEYQARVRAEVQDFLSFVQAGGSL